jgi:hypothetical protein
VFDTSNTASNTVSASSVVSLQQYQTIEPSEVPKGPSPTGEVSFYKKDGTKSSALIYPNGTLTSLPEDGGEKGPIGKPIGQINEKGQYTLTEPDFSLRQNGTIFDDDVLLLDRTDDPLGRGLSKSQLEHAQKNDFQNILPDSAKVDANGRALDGSGVKVLVFDNGGSHALGIQNVLNQIAPEASTVHGVVPSMDPVKMWPKDNSVPEFFTKMYAESVNGLTKELQTQVDKHHPDIVNMSFAIESAEYSRSMLRTIEQYPQMAYAVSQVPGLAAFSDPRLGEKDKIRLMTKYIESLSNRPEVKAATQKFNNFIETASNNGTVFVMGAANSGQLSRGYGVSEGGGFNLLAQNPNIISVGASNPNGTADLTDDTVTLFSSGGTDDTHPTIVAPGNDVIVGKGLESIAPNENGVTRGTSFATPQVAGTIALMKQKNPNLKVDEIKKILTTTAVDTDAPVAQEGAGMLNPVAALQAVAPGAGGPKIAQPLPPAPESSTQTDGGFEMPAMYANFPYPIGAGFLDAKNGTTTIASIFNNGTMSTENGPIGTIDGEGKYQLSKPDISAQQNGTIFDRQAVQIQLPQFPLGQSLVGSELENARKNTFGMILGDTAHTNKEGKALDGTGVKMVVLGEDGQKQVALQQTIGEIAPESRIDSVTVKDFSQSRLDLPTNTPRELLSQSILGTIETATEDVKGALAEHDPKVLVSGLSVSKSDFARRLIATSTGPLKEFGKNAEIDPTLSKVQDPTIPWSERFKAANDYVEGIFKTSPDIQSALKDWNALIGSAAKEGIIVVMPVGDRGGDATLAGATQGESYNLLAANPDVLSIAASHPNNTPDLKDDTITFSSSPGTSQYHPTVAAPGHQVLVNKGQTDIAPNGNGVTWGSPFSAAEAAGVVALMLEKNPNLKVEDVRRILESTAVDTPASPELEGAGMLDPNAAIEAVEEL